MHEIPDPDPENTCTEGSAKKLAPPSKFYMKTGCIVSL